VKIQQYYLACLSHASYMITDEKTKTAVVVDPQRDVDQYLADAKAGGYAIRHVFLTHFHADFIAGHIELRDRAGAKIHLGRRAEAEFECVPMSDGDVVEFGDVRLEILETPGHTPEGISVARSRRTHAADHCSGTRRMAGGPSTRCRADADGAGRAERGRACGRPH